MKSLLKRRLAQSLPGLLKRFAPEQRAQIIRESITDSTYVQALGKSEAEKLLVACAQKTRLTGFLADGEIGVMAGLIGDENVHRAYLSARDWTPSLRDLFRRVLSEGGTYIDVGANIGLTVIPMARLPGVRCIALEPEPTNFRFLRANAVFNDVDGVIEFHNAAAMASAGELVMSISAWNSGDNRIEGALSAGQSIAEVSADGKPLVRVKGVRLDDLAAGKEFSHPCVCKIDTQGAEVEVLKGARELLRQIDLLAIEFWPAGLRRLGGDAESLLQILGEAGFSAGLVTKLDGADIQAIDVTHPADQALSNARRLAQHAGPDDYWDLILSRRLLPGNEAKQI